MSQTARQIGLAAKYHWRVARTTGWGGEVTIGWEVRGGVGLGAERRRRSFSMFAMGRNSKKQKKQKQNVLCK